MQITRPLVIAVGLILGGQLAALTRSFTFR
jgi:hypothetical protein